MNCAELIQYLSEYIDQNLDEELRAEAQEHLATCHNCSIVLDSTQKTILIYKKANQTAAIPSLRREDLYQKIQAALQKRQDCDPSI